jgi:hypothetical protein
MGSLFKNILLVPMPREQLALQVLQLRMFVMAEEKPAKDLFWKYNEENWE